MVIYVSTDVDAKVALAAAAQQPWYRMIFEDDSDFAPLSKGEPEVIEIARGEDFVPAMVSVSVGPSFPSLVSDTLVLAVALCCRFIPPSSGVTAADRRKSRQAPRL
jgi:hypothetical protein